MAYLLGRSRDDFFELALQDWGQFLLGFERMLLGFHLDWRGIQLRFFKFLRAL